MGDFKNTSLNLWLRPSFLEFKGYKFLVMCVKLVFGVHCEHHTRIVFSPLSRDAPTDHNLPAYISVSCRVHPLLTPANEQEMQKHNCSTLVRSCEATYPVSPV